MDKAEFGVAKFGMTLDEAIALWGESIWGDFIWGQEATWRGARFDVLIPTFENLIKKVQDMRT